MEDKDDVIVVSDNLPVEEDINVPKHSSDSVDQPPIGHPHSKTSAVISTLENKEKVSRFWTFLEFSDLLSINRIEWNWRIYVNEYKDWRSSHNILIII